MHVYALTRAHIMIVHMHSRRIIGEDYGFQKDYFNPPDYHRDFPDPNVLNDLNDPSTFKLLKRSSV